MRRPCRKYGAPGILELRAGSIITGFARAEVNAIGFPYGDALQPLPPDRRTERLLLRDVRAAATGLQSGANIGER